MGYVREDDDDLQADGVRRCATCRRELLPWEDTCPQDGGRAVRPDEIPAETDALLARLLAEDDPGTPEVDHPRRESDGDGAPGGD